MFRPLSFVSPITTSAAWPAPDAAGAPGVAATAVVAARAFALVVVFVADASARSAAFSRHLPSVALAAGGPVLVSAGVSGGPAAAARRAFAAVAGISGPV